MQHNHDTTSRALEAHNDVFADIVNTLLFNGEPVIKENELEDGTVHSAVMLNNASHGQERDVVKYWKNGPVRICFLGLENQTKADRDMPLRVISYDGAAYKNQLLDKKKKAKLCPVVTLVLYFGLRRWKKYRRLLECFEVPEKLKPFIQDYKINVFEIAYLRDEQYDMFTSDFKIVANYYMQVRKNNRYVPEATELRHVHDTLQMMKELTRNDEFERIQAEAERIKERKGRVTMDDVITKMIAEGRTEGIAIGMAEGEAIGEARGEAKGRAVGIAEGEARGKMEGRAAGRTEGIAIGIAEGEAKGRAIGMRSALTATARRLIARNMPAADIADITGLELSEVKKLMEQ